MLKKIFSLVLSLVILSAALSIGTYAAEPVNLVKGNITINEIAYPLAIEDQDTTAEIAKVNDNSTAWTTNGSTRTGFKWAKDGSETVLQSEWGGNSFVNSATFTAISKMEDTFDMATQVWEVKVKLGSAGATGYTSVFGYAWNTAADYKVGITLYNGGAYLGLDGEKITDTLPGATVIVPEGTMVAGQWYTVRRVINSTKGDTTGAVQKSYDSIYDETGKLIGSTKGFVNCGNLRTGYSYNRSSYFGSISFYSRRYPSAVDGTVQFKDFKILDDNFTYTSEFINMPSTKGDGQFIAYTPKADGSRKTFTINKQGTLTLTASTGAKDGQFKTQKISQKVLFRDPGKEGAETYLAGAKIGAGTHQHQYSYAITVKNSNVYPKGSDVSIATLEAFKWYTFDVEQNVNDGTATINIYENDTLVGSGTASGLASFTDWETTDSNYRIYSVSFFDSNINADTIYIDDLSHKSIASDTNNTSSITFDGKTYTTSATATNASGSIELAVGDELSTLGESTTLDSRYTTFSHFAEAGSAVIADSFVGNTADNSTSYKITFAGSDVDPDSVASGIYLKDVNENIVKTAVYDSTANTATISFDGLTAGATYTLVIDDNLKSKAYGVPNSSDFSLTFTIAGETEIDDTLVVNNPTATVTEGKLSATVTIHKGKDNTTEKAILIAAAYNGNQLVGIDIKEITLSDGDINYTTDGVEFVAAEGYTYKAFVWGSPLTLLKPLN